MRLWPHSLVAMAAAPYSVSLDPERARQLAASGAALLLLDVPQGTLLGIDQQVCASEVCRNQGACAMCAAHRDAPSCSMHAR